MSKKYKFQTIVATATVRSEFTNLRDKLSGATDKLLMSALWETMDVKAVEKFINDNNKAAKAERLAKKEARKAEQAAKRAEASKVKLAAKLAKLEAEVK